MMYFTPSEVVAGKAPVGQRFNLGGMVAEGSVIKSSDSVDVRFDVTDYDKTITVTFSDILPDLFREGQAVITKGTLNNQGLFVADEVLAKHDETYMPKEVAESLKNRDQQNKNKQFLHLKLFEVKMSPPNSYLRRIEKSNFHQPKQP